jgi:heat shock protein HspQ
MSKISVARFAIGQVVCHRVYEFRGVVFDVDPEFSDSAATGGTILVEGRSRRDQPFYYLLAENGASPYVAYVSEQTMVLDTSDEPVSHPQVDDLFERDETGCYRSRNMVMN